MLLSLVVLLFVMLLLYIYRHICQPLYTFILIYQSFLYCRKSLVLKDLGQSGRPRRPNPLRGKDLGQTTKEPRTLDLGYTCRALLARCTALGPDGRCGSCDPCGRTRGSQRADGGLGLRY